MTEKDWKHEIAKKICYNSKRDDGIEYDDYDLIVEALNLAEQHICDDCPIQKHTISKHKHEKKITHLKAEIKDMDDQVHMALNRQEQKFRKRLEEWIQLNGTRAFDLIGWNEHFAEYLKSNRKVNSCLTVQKEASKHERL